MAKWVCLIDVAFISVLMNHAWRPSVNLWIWRGH